MGDNQFLSNNFWSKKIRYKDRAVFSKKEINNLKIEISKNDLKDFIKISKNNHLSKFTIISSIFSFLIKKYFSSFQNIVKIYPSNLLNLEKLVLLEIKDNDIVTFKELLQSTANEIKETFSYKDYNSTELELDSFSNYSIKFGSEVHDVNDIKDNVSLLYEETDDKIILSIYHQEINKEYLLESLLNNFEDILSNYESFLNREINSYSLTDSKAREQILLNFNATEVTYPSDKNVLDLLESQVISRRNYTAVVYKDRELSYEELNELSNQLGHYLIDNYNIHGDDLICIKLPRSEKVIIAILGILKSGGAYVPIDPEYPKERIDYLLKDTRCKVLIDESFLSEFENQRKNYSIKNPEVTIQLDHLAYVIYTSGTTGNPKGVMIEHRNLFHSTINRINFYSIESMLLVPSFSFDSSVAVIFGVLCSGGRLLLEDNNKIKDLEYISNQIIKYNIDGVLCVPNYYSNLIPYLNENGAGKNNLKHIIVAGEELVKNLVLDHQKHSKATLYNEYGPTECAVWSSVSVVENTNVNIGRSIPNTEIYILDENRHLLPIGVAGELYISGAGLARGYLNLPDLSSEKFVANPFVDGRKMYRTGDLGRWLPDGNIEYLGRIDHQVKIRGHRIELGEIENQVFSYNTSIKFTIADVKEHEGEKSLVVYYVSDTIIDKQKLSEYLESKLPQYMLPSFYVALESMPLTSNGKIDRKMLPEVSSIDLIKTEYIAPRSSEEHALVSVFEQVLKYNPISIRDNYYNLGGDSIKSIQIVSRLRQLGYNLKVEHILRYPVLEELARYITIDVSEINQSAVTGDSVLTPIQRYFFGNENIVNKNHYNQAVILKSSERLSYSVLESSIQSLVNHHDALRMLYREENGKWSQYNSGTEGNHYHFEYFDVREEGSLEAELASLEKIGEHLQSNIDIESGILFHIGHVSMSDMDRIILVIHHLVVDGVSWRILLEDLGNLYDSGIKGVSYELPSKTDSFQSWGTTLEAYSKSPILSKEYLYWDSIESDVYPAIATDYTLNGKHILDTSINFSLNEESTKLLQTHVGKEYSAEINDVLLTGLALSLQEEFGINKTKILMEGHGREAMSTGLDISRTVGWFTTLYPFSLDISNNNQPALVSVKDGLRGIPNKGIGYGILNYLGDSFSSTNNPSIQFNYLGDFDDAIGHQFYYSSESIGISVSEENLGTDILLDVSGITISGKMNLTIRYSSSVFHAATVQKLMDNYQSHLEKMIHKEKESEVILTPSDLTYKELPFNTIQEINKSFDIEDIYELSPMQQGLYYHWMAAPKGSAYFMQTSYRSKFEGFEVLEVERAFGILVNRYTVLRTSFDNRFGEVPLQIVHKKAQVDFEYLTIASEDSLEIDLESIKQNDITRGFDLSKPTQMRLIIVKLPNDTYEFIWSYHHIVMDGWCLSILINDFSAILDSVKQGLEINLPEPQKYSAYLKWLGGIDKDSSMLHWKNYLEGISAPTLIPFEKRTKDELPHFVTEKFNVTGDEFKEISQLCQNLGVTLNTYIQAIWSYLLSKYNSSEEIIFGAVVSGRPAEIDNIEHMVGLFINTIPVRISVKNDDTPYSLLKKVHQDSIQNTEYHFNSLAEVQSLSPLGKDLLSNIIIFENYVKQDVSNTSNLGLIDENVDTFEQTNYDFNIVVVPGRNNLSVYFKYNASVFYESLVKSLVSHFKHLLGQFVACPDQQINNFSYLSTSEVKELLDDFNETEISYPSEETIVSLFESQVANTPDNIAVVFGDINLSYQELNKQSNQLAHYLSEKYDIKCDDLICIQLPRSEKMIISILGVLKSGGAYVPIDNDYPQNRIDYIVEDTKSKVIIDEKFWLEFNLLKDDYSVDKQDVAVKSSDLAYVIYTSGTTGNPKGVMIEHKNVVRLFFNDNALYDFNSNDSWTLFHSYNFDFSVWECYGALLFGGCLHVIPKRVAQDVGMFLNYLITNKITILNQTPAAFYNLAGYDRAFNHQELALRYIIFGGEALNPYLLKDWQSKYPDIKLINMYGITETTVHVTYKELSVKDTNSVLSNIGKPIPTLNCYILDENRHLLPIGVAGELYISGAGLARGYLNLPDLSSEKFVANPFVDGRKMYRTGDLGRWLPDGNIEYLGRIDHQVKIRGHRIELGEIENQVFSYNTSIKFTIADVKEHEGEKSLVVYYVSDTIIDKQKLSEYLESKLPQYMLPSFYVALESMPLTSNGKIDRKMLPEVSSIDLIKTEYIAPRSSEEHALVSVFEQVLKYNPISIRDNYYNLGGDSIKSIQIVSRLRQLGYNLKVEHILRYPVLEELARYITIDVSEINQSAVTGDSVLTPIQRYFFGNENIVNKNHYNQAVILKSSERLSYSVLESSIQSLVNHHDALRMLYREENGKWSQYNSGTEGNHYHFEYFDVREEGSLEAELASLEKIGEHLQSNIDIESGILFHIGHVSMSDMDRIILVIHHLVVDGVSWRILLEDLGNLYDSGIKGVSYELPSKTDSFQSWGTTLEAYSKSPILSKEYLYWDSIESDVYPAIATDYTLNGKHILDTSINFSLNEESTKLLQTHVGKEYSAEINDVLLTGLALSLQEEFGINKTKILMEGHGREAMSTGLDISRTVGWFTTLYPFSLDISNNNQPALVSVKDGLRGIPNKGIGYGILNYLGDSFSSTNNPSIQFNYLGDFDDAIGHQFYYSSESIGISVSEENLGTDILLDVSGITISGKMNLTIRYSSSVFHAATVQKLMDNYQSHLEKMIHKEKESEVILTPSDLTYKELPFNTIQEINKSFDIEDIYELSPMQQGLYYHWMAAPKGSAYFMQTSYRSKFEGFEVLEVERAFGILVNRYTVLRTSFDNRFGEVPLQIVHKKAQVDFEYLTIASEDSLEIDLESIKQNDITRGFDLSKPTQMRLIIVKLPNDTYEFIWSYHHIVMDGWCLSILINDFSAILDSVKQGLEINLPEPQKYSAYLKWLGGIDKDSSMLHWKNYLEGISAPTLIPFEKRTKDELPHFVTEKFNVTGDEFKEISQLCQNLGVTLNTYIQAIWSYLLSKYNSSEEIIFGAVVSGRPAEIDNIEHMVGLFINTIPVRISVKNDDTPYSLLKKVHQDSIQNTEYHFNSLAEVQSLSPLGKDLLSNIIIFENYVKNEPNENFENIKVFDQSNYNFTLVVEPYEDYLHIDFEYNASVYSSYIKVLVSHFKNTLNQFKTHINTPLSEIDYLTFEAREELLKHFNSTLVLYPEDKTIVSLFEDQISLTPDSTAVVFEDIRLSYAELNAKASCLAHQLKDTYGIKKGDQVGVMLNRGENQIISILGILKLGAIYVPIDANLPKSRKEVMTSGLSLLITESYYFFDLDFYSGNSFSIDLEFTDEDASDFKSEVLGKDDIAYIIYTSGSTGEPKGVLNTHRGILNTMLFQKDFFEVPSCENVAQFASFSFDASISEIFMTLLCGKSLHILSDSVRKDAYAFEEYVEKHSIDLVTLPPAFFSLLNVNKLQKLKGLITAGESAVIVKTKEYLKYGTFYNAYGPTETSICATVYKIEKGSELKSSAIPIGKPIANTQIYILDSHGHLVPIGVVGELYISGSGLARGYLNLEELTEDKFLDNPFVPGTKMYRTGDLGRWLPDGNIEYLGRIDHQVKIRGHRIELGEIDSYVLTYNADIKSVVTEVKEHGGDKILVVYYVSGSPIDKHDLSQYLAGKLPQYMLPGFYVELDHIPLTSNGKVDRKSLPEVSSTDMIKNEYVAARNEEEQVLVSICEQVLKYRPISIRDNYYNLGGDSIKSIQIVSRLRQQGYSLKVEHILQYPILEELAGYITTDIVEIDQSVVIGESILTPIQRYFFESEDIVNKNHYNQSVILKSTEKLSVAALETSIKRLVEHHDALRMVYSEKAGFWVQYNSGIENNHYHLQSFDLKDSGSNSEELSRLQEIGEELQSSIDITSGVLFHVGHVSMSDGERLILVVHHLVVDGVSWRILLEDLGKLYKSEVQGLSYELPSKTDSFQRWGNALEDYSKSSALSKERLYWEGIESETYASITTDYPVKGKQILENSLGFDLNTDTTKLLQTLAGRKYNAEINDVLLTGLALSLKDQFGVCKTKVLMEGHGRETMGTGLDISRTVGWFTSVYPFNLDISDDSQPVMVSVKEGMREIPNKGIGYGILNYLNEPFTPKSLAWLQFNYLGDFDDAGNYDTGESQSLFSYSSENIGPSVSLDNLFTDILLDVSGMTVNGVMNINIRFSNKVFTANTIESLLSAYQSHLESMIRESEDSSVALTPSDLTYKYKGLSFSIIEEISKDAEIEDIYELSPMQQGLYYHWLVNPKGLSYFMQTSYRVKASDLDLSLIEKAFGALVNRYTILRTSFENRYGEVPLQIVHKEARVDFKHLILASELELDNIKQGDIDRGFILSEPTQMRLLVVELPDGYYEFIWSHHHIIMDGWCLSILINDFSTILGSLQNGISIPLPDTEKYSSYIKWLESVDKEEALAYWKNYLQGIDSPTLIPFVNTDEASSSHYLTETLSIRDHDFGAIENFCQDLGITLNTYVQGAWSYLLSSYNSSEEVVFGSVVSGRPAEIPGIENMVGLFINTIPVCARIGEEDTPRSLLNQIHQDSIQSSRYHFNSLAEIQSLSSLGKELINHIIVFENYVKNDKGNVETSSYAGLSSESVGSFEQTNYPLTIVAVPDHGGLHIEFRYDASLLSTSSMKFLVSHFKEVLHQFVFSSEIPLKSLDYISSEEKAILESFNSTEVNYPSDETIISLFEKQVLITPDHIAVVYEDISLTYFELNARSNQLAHYLREKYSINGDDLICIELPRSDKMIEGILGILKSGGAYVPIDVDYPQDRKDYILADTNSKVTIDESFLLDFELVRNYYSTENVDIFIRPDHLAYIIYTSGTTGNPKGVMIEHKNVVRLLFNDHSLYDFNSNDSWTLFHSYNFDFSVWECYGALLYGGSLHVITRKTAQDPGSFLSYLIKNNITILNQTPAAFYNLSEYDKLFNQGQLALRYIIFGGEALNPLMLQDFHRKYPEIRMINMYGITETTVHVTYKELSAADMTRSLSNIGKPIATLGCYILDKYHHIVPIGVVGELYISGSGLARGYLNLEELTEDKFLDNPFVPGTKMYRTGDLGRWLPDGNIEYLGRIDHQVKIRGHRIELGEIDSYVLTYNADIKSVVTEVKEHGGDKILVVYYVSGSPIDKHDLSQYLAGKLPQYMLPGFYVELDHIPLTSNGKVDRKSLPEVSSTDMIKNEYVAPSTETELLLVELLSKILNYQKEDISIQTNFFDMGLNSLSIVKFSQLLRKNFGLEIDIAKFFSYPNVSELAQFIQNMSSYTEETTVEDQNLSDHVDNLIDNLFE